MGILTHKQRFEYLNGNWTKCPYCKSTNIEADKIEVDGKNAWSVVVCRNCDETWMDVYKLTDVVATK